MLIREIVEHVIIVFFAMLNLKVVHNFYFEEYPSTARRQPQTALDYVILPGRLPCSEPRLSFMLFLKAKLSLLPSHYLLPVLREQRFALFWFNFCGNFLSQLNDARDAAPSDDLIRKR